MNPQTPRESAEYLFSEAVLFGEPREHEKKAIIDDFISKLKLWIGNHKKVCKCDPENGMCICGALEHNTTLSELIYEINEGGKQ